MKTGNKRQIYQKLYRQTHREQIAKTISAWVAANPERVRAIKTKWRELHMPQHLHTNKLWRLRNPNYFKKWARENRAIRRNLEDKRRAKIRNNSIGDPHLIRKIYARAQELREWFDVVVDHIIPISKGGAHSPENLQIIYAFENARKGSSLTYKPRVVFL